MPTVYSSLDTSIVTMLLNEKVIVIQMTHQEYENAVCCKKI